MLKPFEELDVAFAGGSSFLVGPVGGDTFRGDPVHIFGADLDFHKIAIGTDYRGVDRLIPVGLGMTDEVLEAAVDGRPEGMNYPQDLIALLDVGSDDPKGDFIINFVDGNVLHQQLFVDAVEVFRATQNAKRGQVVLPQMKGKQALDPLHVGLAVR